jgi:hypothetical protein
MCRVALSALVAVVASATVPARSLAYERQLHIGVEMQYGQYRDPGTNGATEPVHGGGIGARVRWGLTDAFAIEGQLGWAGHSLPLENGGAILRQAATGAVGARYAIDVFALVPSIAVLVGAHFVFQDIVIAPAFLLDIQAAVDWCPREDFAVGIGASYQLDFGPYGVPHRLVLSARVAWQRGFARRSRGRAPP